MKEISDFLCDLNEEILDTYLSKIIAILNSSDMDIENLNPPNKTVTEIYRSLNDTHKKDFEKYLKYCLIDALSIILGGIDGVSDLGTSTGEYELYRNGQLISGDLKDEFWAIVE